MIKPNKKLALQRFLILTIFGNAFILINAFIFYYIEMEANQNIKTYLDAIWWSYVTVTSVGYGDIVPITQLGKVHAIILMISGTGLFLSYSALFVQALVGRDIEDIDVHIQRIEREVAKVKKLEQQIKSKIPDLE